MTNNTTAPKQAPETNVIICQAKQAHQIADECGTKIDRLQGFVPFEAAMEAGRALNAAQARIAMYEAAPSEIEVMQAKTVIVNASNGYWHPTLKEVEGILNELAKRRVLPARTALQERKG